MTQLKLDPQDPPHYDFLQENNHIMQDSADNNQQPPQLPPPPMALPKPTSAWQRTVERVVTTVATPMNNIAVRRGTNSFVSQPPILELQKATSILSQFTSHAPTAVPPTHSSHHEPIPASELSSSTALLILTTLRFGFRHLTLSSGSGILLVRRPDSNPNPNLDPGSTSTNPVPPPSGTPREWAPPVTVKTLSVGAGPFALGVDVSDRVYVIQTHEALDMLLKGRCVGSVEGVVALGHKNAGGGIGFPFQGFKSKKEQVCGRCGDNLNLEVHHGDGDGNEMLNGKHHLGHGVRKALNQPIQCYVRSAGLYCGFQAEGMMVTEREEENRAFYGRDVSVGRGVIPTGEEEMGMDEGCKEALNALRVVLERAEAGREKME
ncbi:hypothetical protein B0T16DRAFT_72567 [Cercophora newfieldiana]|uniref:Ysc84 actin-binding domain-containing protein n=1 Tax=Cercophora newfieldiana TaxID=92897 RepID=A0AA39YE91_9PEZI|nr:hypothetical protein B0T16DRAFT_72567 [Cercophora newfieldiana]